MSFWRKREKQPVHSVVESAPEAETETREIRDLVVEDMKVSFTNSNDTSSGIYRLMVPADQDIMLLYLDSKVKTPTRGKLSFTSGSGLVTLEGALHRQRNGAYLFKVGEGDILNRRRWERAKTRQHALLRTQENETPLTLEDFAPGGAKLVGETNANIGEDATLILPELNLQIGAHVLDTENGTVRVAFSQTHPAVEETYMELLNGEGRGVSTV